MDYIHSVKYFLSIKTEKQPMSSYWGSVDVLSFDTLSKSNIMSINLTVTVPTLVCKTQNLIAMEDVYHVAVYNVICWERSLGSAFPRVISQKRVAKSCVDWQTWFS